MPSSHPRPPLTPVSRSLPPQQPSGHGPPSPSAVTAQTGLSPGVWHAPTTQTPSQMVAVTPQMTAVSPELCSQRRGNVCPAEYPLAAARGHHGGPSRPSNMNQEAGGMGRHPAGGGGTQRGWGARRAGTAGQQDSSRQPPTGQGLTPRQRPHPGQPPPAEPLASSPHFLNASWQDQGTRGTPW